jgi:hypothetical protein
MPRRTGSAIPYARRRDSIFSESWVARQASRRASNGCVEEGISAADGWLVEEAVAVAGRVSLLRRVSGRPGAEGAPLERCVVCWRVEVLVVEVRLPLGGAMRRDWMVVG